MAAATYGWAARHWHPGPAEANMGLAKVLYYHQLVQTPRPGHFMFASAPTPDSFRLSMQMLKQRYRVIRVEELHEQWRNRRAWPHGTVVITFDDGFKNNLWAAHVLSELGMSATFFVLSDVVDTRYVPPYLRFLHIMSTRKGDVFETPTGRVDFGNVLSSRRWRLSTKEQIIDEPPDKQNGMLDELAEIFGSPPLDPDDRDYHFVSSADLREMVDLGMTVGSHGATHQKLSRCTDAELQCEIVESRNKLETITGRPVEFISYPDGRFDERVLRLAERTYKMGFAAVADLPADHPYRYPRFPVGNRVTEVLSRWYLPKRRCIRVVKRVLGEPLPRWDG